MRCEALYPLKAGQDRRMQEKEGERMRGADAAVCEACQGRKSSGCEGTAWRVAGHGCPADARQDATA